MTEQDPPDARLWAGVTRLARIGEQLQVAAAELTEAGVLADLGGTEETTVRAAAAVAQKAGDDVLQAVTAVLGARRSAGGKDGPTMRRALLSAPVRDLLMFELTELGSLKEIGDAFAEVSLPEPVPDDRRVLKSQKAKLISRFFDAIEWEDRQQVDAVLTLLQQALARHRNRIRRFGGRLGELTQDLLFRDLQLGLASDGWHLTDNLRVTPLDGPAPIELPAPERIADPKAAFESAVHDALSAAQTIRALLGASGNTGVLPTAATRQRYGIWPGYVSRLATPALPNAC
ncbi:hypothetical protein [Actinoplanes sp. NPDC020271]|uniref:hypothetical protein n=1 Tax=Actinoplanes sp. NPDC020271 TaxID=3363896 RepID=UPI003788C0E9